MTRRRLRVLEGVALTATVSAFAVTLAMRPFAVERNVVARWLFDALGYRLTGLLAVLTVAGAFALFRRVRPVAPRAVVALAPVVTVLSVADLGINLVVVARLGWPALAPSVLSPVVGMAALASLLWWRPNPRALPRPSQPRAAAALAAVMVASVLIGPAAPLLAPIGADPVEPVAAASDPSVYLITSQNNADQIQYLTADGARVTNATTTQSIYDIDVASGTGIIAGTGGYIAAFDATDGSKLWRRDDLITSVTGDVNATSTDIYVTDNTVLRKLQHDGTPQSNVTVGNTGLEIGATDALVVVGLSGGNVEAYSPAGLSPEWTATHNDDVNDVVLNNGQVFIANKSGVMALDSSTGSQQWGYSTSNNVYGVTVGPDGNIWATDKGVGYVELDPSTGNVISSFTSVEASFNDVNALGALDGNLLGGGTNKDYLRSLTTGNSTVWRTEIDGNPAEVVTATSGESTGTITGTVTDAINGSAVKGASVTAVNQSSGATDATDTTDAGGAYSLSLDNGTAYKITVSKSGYDDNSKSITPTSDTTLDFSLIRGTRPYLTSIDPWLDVYRDDRNVDLRVGVDDDDSSDVSVEWYLFDRSEGDFDLVKSATVAAGTTSSATVTAEKGQNYWYVRLDDKVTTPRKSSTFKFETPNDLEVYNGSDLTLIQPTQVTATVRGTTSNFQTTTTTTSGTIDMSGFPEEKLRAEVGASGYENQTMIIDDPSDERFVVLNPTDAGPGPVGDDTYEQRFTLVDNTGNYAAGNTTLEVKEYIDGNYRIVASDLFGAVNEASVSVQDGNAYRLQARNQDGDVYSLGDFVGNDSLSDDVLELTIEGEVTDTDGSGTGSTQVDPVAAFNYSPTDPVAGNSIEFDGRNSTDYDGSVSEYRWDWTNDGSIDDRGPTQTHTYTSDGVYDVRLVVVDDDGNRGEIVESVYVANDAANASDAPVARFSIDPAPAAVGETVFVDASASSDDGSIVEHEWDLDGDGQFETNGTTATTNYSVSQVVPVSLRVTDDDGGQDIRTKYLVVGEGTKAASAGFRWTAYYAGDVGQNGSIRFAFEMVDETLRAQDYRLKIYEYGNETNEIYNTSYGTLRSLTHTEGLTAEEANMTWVVEATFELNGETRTIQAVVGDTKPLLTGLPIWLRIVISIGTIWVVGGLFSEINAEMGSLVVAGLGGMFWFIGFLPETVGLGVVILAMAVAGFVYIRGQRGGVPS